ncbi:chaplin [Streptomyces sioyaensis]|uniref:Chaplin n=1 Tax=Streptomyces sioyaensis TaxID=67364 RepID=A0A4Q1RAG5_9ACTN|nr:chaplin [Streptomyces sioyaensis]MBM4791392.1 chaplin [Streptomyces sioyaensis]RXS70421.1 chaplin [Streptomyces sioyaensis]
MKRFVTTAAIATVSCAVVLSGAGIASASTDGHHGNHGRHDHGRFGRDGRGFGGATAAGFAAGSPGILSGNNIQVPINIPINVCGNSVNAPGLLNPAFGNVCINR